MSRVEGKMSRVQKCRRFFLLSFIVYIFYYYFLNFFVSKNIDFVYIQALSLLSKKPEFLGRFSMTCIEQFTSVLYTIEYFRSVSSIQKISRFHFLVARIRHRSEENHNNGLYARQPGTVSNTLNNVHQIAQKAFLKPHETIISLFRNVKRFQKLFWLCS